MYPYRDILCVVFWDGIDGLLYRQEIAGAVGVDHDHAVARRAGPVVVVVVLGGVELTSTRL